MAGPADFQPIAVTDAHIAAAKQHYADMGEYAKAGELGWAGFVVEEALCDAGADFDIRKAPIFDYDLEFLKRDVPPMNEHHPERRILAVEVKTRVAERGWTHPEKYDWLIVPTHDGREPIKPVADLVLFCWYPVEEAHRAWALGYVRGVDEFRRRAVFYRENEPLPRGGWAKAGGAYALDIKDLRPLPRRMLKEIA